MVTERKNNGKEKNEINVRDVKCMTLRERATLVSCEVEVERVFSKHNK